jgi:uncharacterized protein (TIGR00369 family)
MSNFNPIDENFESRIQSNFDRQHALQTLNARLIKICAGEVHIEFPYNDALTQQDGFIHAGMLTAVVDSACGYAAYTLMPADSRVLTVEYKVNFLSPAKAEKFIGIGKVIKPGHTLTACSGEVWAIDHGEDKLIAIMQATMIMVEK